MVKNRQAFEGWINEIDQACRVSDRDFRTEIFKKSTSSRTGGTVSVMHLTDDELVAKLRSCFSYAPTMNEARWRTKESMRQLEHKSTPTRWGRALYRGPQESTLKMRGTPMSSKTSFCHWRRTSGIKSPTNGQKWDSHPVHVLARPSSWQITWKNSYRWLIVSSLQFPNFPPVEVNEIKCGRIFRR